MPAVTIETRNQGQCFATYGLVRRGQEILHATDDLPFGFDSAAIAAAIAWAMKVGLINHGIKSHPKGTVYDVLVPGHAARRRGVTADEALRAERCMHDEGLDLAIIVAHLPDGTRIRGCIP